MFYWGELSSTDSDGSKRTKNRLEKILNASEVLDVCIGEGLIAFLRKSDRKVIVVTSRGRSAERSGKRGSVDLQKARFSLLSCGQAHLVLVSESGRLSEWKISNLSPRIIKSLPGGKIAQVTCGNNHTIVLTQDNQLLAWGQNSCGQLGLGKDETSLNHPQSIKSLCGIPLTQIKAGGDHSFVLSVSGTVFAWGKNRSGQLGLGDRRDRNTPVCVKSLNQKRTVFISCGMDHTAVLTKEGVMLTFGSGCHGQLGHNSFRDELRPRVVGEFWGARVSQIASGWHHTVALVGSSEIVYTFGSEAQGQLGNPQRTTCCVPLRVPLPSYCNPAMKVHKIVAGGNMSIVFTTSRKEEMKSTSFKVNLCTEKIIKRWTSKNNSASWKNTQREIRKMFSSASCINGSFIERSDDKHYKTSSRNSGLDLSLARIAFEMMATKQEVLKKVGKVVKINLLPSLGSSAACVEALRVYLVLPELLRVLNEQQEGKQLAISLASSILKLDQDALDVLSCLWTTLPYEFFKSLVTSFHTVAAAVIIQMVQSVSVWSELTPVLKVLQKLYTVNTQRHEKLTEDCFHIQETSGFINSIKDTWTMIMTLGLYLEPDELYPLMGNPHHLIRYPFILTMSCKCSLFQFLQKNLQPFSFLHSNQLCVNRHTVLEDMVAHLKQNSVNFCSSIKVKFALEDGMDFGGVCKEFFTLLGQEIIKTPSILSFEDSGLFWFSADNLCCSEEMYYVGVICGMALYNHCSMNIGFPLALFKKLLDHRLTLTDLEELSPVEARSLKELLNEDEDVVEALYLNFTVKGKELIPNGEDMAVTPINRQNYVDLYVDFVFNTSVETQFREFERGFSCGSPSGFWRMFKPEELMDLLCGTSEYKWEELQKVAKYKNCAPSDELIQNFWTVFLKELDEEHKKKFLKFVYGTDRLPVGGISELHLTLVRSASDDADNRFPEAQTCFRLLLLPNYSNINVLRNKLIHAITFCEVFGQQ